MKSHPKPVLELRCKIIRSRSALREMLPGSFVERTRACGRLVIFPAACPDALRRIASDSKKSKVLPSREPPTRPSLLSCLNWRQISGVLDGQMALTESLGASGTSGKACRWLGGRVIKRIDVGRP